MKIWLINHYAVPPQYYPLARPSAFAKNLIKMGHDVTIIAASTVHNSEKNLIEGNERVKKITDDGVPYVLIKCTDYKGNGLKRIKNIYEFANRLPKILDTMDKPNVIMATCFDPLSCYAGIQYAKKHKIKAVAEIADLWPETLVDYKGVSKNNPVVQYLRIIEKSIYTKADKIVFTMEGAYDYIIEQGWEKEIPRDKVVFINNGIDLEQFEYNRDHYHIDDSDLNNPELFKVVYVGSIRTVNNLGLLLDTAKDISNERIRFLIWGTGDELDKLKKRVIDEKIKNVVFKGFVEKKYIAYITTQADLNLIHNNPSVIFKYGISFNKLFDYLASGKPSLTTFPCKYNPAVYEGAGVDVERPTSQEIAKVIDQLSINDLTDYGIRAKEAAKKYDYKALSMRLRDVIDNINNR